jgi:cobalt/nickel transport system permease protein
MTTNEIPSFLLDKSNSSKAPDSGEKRKRAIVNKGIERFAEVMKTGFIQWELASQNGFFQNLDARLKISFLILFAVVISLKSSLLVQVAIGIFLLGLAAISRLDLVKHYRKVLALGFIFGFLVALPSALNIVSGGPAAYPILHLSKPHQFWIYHIPQVIGFTREGIQGVSLLTLRVINSLATAFLVISTTPFAEVIKALKVMRVPDIFLITITLAYKYIFIFAVTIYDMHLAKKSRLIVPESSAHTRRWIAGRMAFLFNKSQHRCDEVFKAMQQRGFSGSISLRGYGAFTQRDWLVGSLLLCAGIILLFI